MPFVKLDCGILNSTLWIDRIARELFITSLLMAEPFEVVEPMDQIAIGSLDLTGWVVPAGWYGFVPAASSGIIHRAGYDDRGAQYAAGMEALRRLGEPEPESRSKGFEGRRMVRVDGGFLILNYIAYREKDSTTAERSRRWRARKKQLSEATRVTDTPTRVIRHQAEAEAEANTERPRTPIAPKRRVSDVPSEDFERFWALYPRKIAKAKAWQAWAKLNPPLDVQVDMCLSLEAQKKCEQWTKDRGAFVPHASTWIHGRRWEDEIQQARVLHQAVPSHAPWECRHLEQCANSTTCRVKDEHPEKYPLKAEAS